MGAGGEVSGRRGVATRGAGMPGEELKRACGWLVGVCVKVTSVQWMGGA